MGDLIEALKRLATTRVVHSPKWLKPILAASIFTILAVAAGIGIWTWRNSLHPPGQAKTPVIPGTTQTVQSANSSKIADNPNISGHWRAVVQKEDVRYEIYLTFEVVGDKLFGKAIYPTGEAGILNGTIRQNRISFITKHVPDFADEEATITVEGKVSSDEIQVFTQDRDGYAKGVAHRVAQVSKAKVLTP